MSSDRGESSVATKSTGGPISSGGERVEIAHAQLPHHLEPQRGSGFGAAVKALFQFLGAILTLPLWFFRRRKLVASELTLYSAHPSFFLWLPILVGFVAGAWVRHDPTAAAAAGWIYIWVLVYFVASLLYDFSTHKLLLWVGIFTLIWLASKYVELLRDVAILGYVFRYLGSLHPMLDPGTVTVLSWILLLPWIGSLVHMVLNGRKRFTPNEIGEFHFGEGCELTDRTGLRFRTQYRDVLEALLTFGGGDLIAVDNHQNVIKRYDNIVGLFFAWRDLDRILHQRSVVESIDGDDEPAAS